MAMKDTSRIDPRMKMRRFLLRSALFTLVRNSKNSQEFYKSLV
jgi:hypothetical protein